MGLFTVLSLADLRHMLTCTDRIHIDTQSYRTYTIAKVFHFRVPGKKASLISGVPHL